MQVVILCFEIIGTAAFAVSGALTGLRKEMDIFGVCMLGLTTAVGGGMTRDVILNITPPAAFTDPKYIFIALVSSIIVFLPFVQQLLVRLKHCFELLLIITDSLGLAAFTVCGVKVAFDTPYGSNLFLVVFVAVLTGVGGGVLRDVFAGDRPYIFIKHIYACAAIVGAVACALLWNIVPQNTAMIIGMVIILITRYCSAKYRWSLPKAKMFRL